MRLLVCVLIFKCLFFHSSRAQSANQYLLEDAAENSAETINESGESEIPDELIELPHHPVDLNGDPEILVRYNLISPSQLNSLEEYKERMGALVEPEELQQVDDFDSRTIHRILPFCTVRQLNAEQSRHKIMIRLQKNNSIAEGYPGTNEKLLFRYRGSPFRSLQITFTGEKDPGEEFFPGKKTGFDFQSINITWTGKKFIRKIIAGDFSLEFGQGLTMWSGLSFGGGNEITGIYKSGRGIVPYTGTDENRFFRGLALNAQSGKLKFDVWFSHHGIDGNLVEDTVDNSSFVTSLQTSGYHRTEGELTDRHSQHETVYGTSVAYVTPNFTLGLTGSALSFDVPVENEGSAYEKFRFSGTNSFNGGLFYSYSIRNVFLFGEISHNTRAHAIISGILVSLDPRCSMSLLWRSYSKEYFSLHSNAFGKNSDNSNENGIYAGINYKLTRTLTYSGYTDAFTFPFLKYRTDQSSTGFDLFNRIQFIPNKKFNAAFVYRKKMKQQNDDSESFQLNKISDIVMESFRVSVRFKINDGWEYSFRAELSNGGNENEMREQGTMISQDIFYKPLGKKYGLNFRYAVFTCPDFDMRIYEYENDVQGSFSVPFYYGNGSRFYTNINLKPFRNTTLNLRYAITWNDEARPLSEFKIQLILDLK